MTIQKSLKPSELPSEDALLAAARELIASTYSWKRGKSFQKNKVHTFSRTKGPGDGAAWHGRVSEHTAEDATFDEFWSKIGHDHANNEVAFMKEVKKATLVKQVTSNMSIWSMYYEFTPPVSPRVFTVLQFAHLDETSPRTGFLIQVPVDITEDPELAKLEEKAVKGHYCSVEIIKELENGNVEWRMATSSSPGGSIPTFIVESSMASTISADVPHFLNWYHSIRPKATSTLPNTVTPTATADIPVPGIAPITVTSGTASGPA